MTIQRVDNEIIIKVSDNVSIESLQRLLDFLKYNEVTEKSVATQSQVDQLSKKINLNWWNSNKERLLLK